MPKRGKSYKAALEKYNKAEQYEVREALELAIQTSRAKFDETVEAHFKMGVDGKTRRSADQRRYRSSTRNRQIKESFSIC